MSNQPIISTPYGVNNNYGLAERTANPTTIRVQRERPILFKAEMVRAILAGTKTQTRRLVTPQPKAGFEWCRVNQVGPWYHIEADKPETVMHTVTCKQGQVGDRLWVRENWQVDAPCDGTWASMEFYGCRESKLSDIPERFRKPEHCLFQATWSGSTRWRPSIHMPRWASRITLEITGVRVERLNDCSEADAKAEGIERVECGDFGGWKNYRFETTTPRRGVTITDEQHRVVGYGYARASYQSLWEKINGTGSWAKNPWVWVIEFRRVAA